MLIGVWDRSPAVPVFRTPANDEEGSRGLAIVEALADEWGYQRVSEGKIVWARLAIPGDAAAPVPLARRSVATELSGPRAVQAADDLALLEQARMGLLKQSALTFRDEGQG